FSDLYIINELFVMKSAAPDEISEYANTLKLLPDLLLEGKKPSFPGHYFAKYLLGTLTESNQPPMRFHNYTELPVPAKTDVFLVTVAMQAFFLLHELGHLALNHFSRLTTEERISKRYGVFRRQLELEADMWAGVRMWSIHILGMSRVPRIPLEAVIRSFALFEFLRTKGWLDSEVISTYPSPEVRWQQVAQWADPVLIARPKSHFLVRGISLGKYADTYI
ncbi:MAG: hypothetical protein WAN65_14535, partial [Candidatus Sulfotelmatobacter sp.]